MKCKPDSVSKLVSQENGMEVCRFWGGGEAGQVLKAPSERLVEDEKWLESTTGT